MVIYSLSSFAQIGPVGPQPDSRPEGGSTPSGESHPPPVDLPYKPAGGEKPKRAPAVEKDEFEGGFFEAAEWEQPIPYITSKSPEPLGAPDPEF